MQNAAAGSTTITSALTYSFITGASVVAVELAPLTITGLSVGSHPFTAQYTSNEPYFENSTSPVVTEVVT